MVMFHVSNNRLRQRDQPLVIGSDSHSMNAELRSGIQDVLHVAALAGDAAGAEQRVLV